VAPKTDAVGQTLRTIYLGTKASLVNRRKERAIIAMISPTENARPIARIGPAALGRAQHSRCRLGGNCCVWRPL